EFWQSVGSQAVQDICQRIEKAYQLFFKHHKKGKQVVYIDQWYPSSKTCSCCGHVLEKLDLSVREWRCPSCQSVNGRDHNASKNIQTVGASMVGLGDVRRCETAIAV
ncbi:zinc ribbon domain-containing protein, partial [Nostoc sp.]|uniref:zinc ribbon domain-containing protein n=1 Tax=Nostoc sp. TaxID=1180 RepID=UPI002FF9B7AA